MRMPETPGGNAVFGALFGALCGVALVLVRERYTFAKDWFLIVLLTVISASAWYAHTRFGLSWFSLIGVGLCGAGFGGWLGYHLVGSYEYSVPTPQSEREMTIIWSGGQKVLPV